MAVPTFSAKAYSYLYNQEIYLRSYDTTGTNVNLVYEGKLAGFPKDGVIPSALTTSLYIYTDTYYRSYSGKTIEELRQLNGWLWDRKFINFTDSNNNSVDIYLAIIHFRYSQGYYAYRLTSIAFINDLAVSTEIWQDPFQSTSDDWSTTWDSLNPYIYFTTYNNGVTVSPSLYVTLYACDLNNKPYVNSFYMARTYKIVPVTQDLPEPEESFTPYSQGGYSEGSGGFPSSTGGGLGTYTYTHEPVDFPSPPAINASNTGFITLYNPNLAQILNLADYMWNQPFDINNLKKLFANPMDCILGLSILPVAIPNAGAQEICIGNLIASGVSANVASSQYVWFDCGSVELKEFYGSYLDYAPYTKIELYLPYVGNVTINPDEVQNKTINIRYLIDILSGSFMCFVKCGDTILYNFSGSCATMVPITGNDWSDLYRAVGEMALTAVGAGVAGAGLVAGAVGSAGAEMSGAEMVSDAFSVGKDVAVGTAGAVMGSKPSIQRSGSLGGSVGQLGVPYPYFTITLPRQCLPQNANKINGYPSQVYSKLGDLTGLTVVQNMHLENISGTDAERNEITSLLSSGVIL